MYAESGVMFSCFHNFSQQIYGLHNPILASSSSSASTVSEYDLGEEGDLFKAPEPIIEEPTMGLDPMAAAISMLSCHENASPPRIEDVVDIGSIQNEQLLNDVFYECEMDLLAKSAMEEPYAEVQDIKIPAVHMEMDTIAEKDGNNLESSIQKSVSSGCLTSMEWMLRGAMSSTFPVPYGMRRAYSEGDMQNLGNGNTSIVCAPPERSATIGNCTIEERREKLSRYWKKKSKRNFSRKIKYACRKALADSQPRIRGRFAKTEESEVCKKHSA